MVTATTARCHRPDCLNILLPPAYVVRREGTVFTGVCLLTFRGGTWSQVRGGVPGLRFGGVPSLRFGGGTWSQVRGGSWSQVWGREYLVSGPGGGPSVKGKFLTPDLA